MLSGRVPAKEDRQEWYECWRCPGDANHASSHVDRHVRRVLERPDDGVVTVDRDAAEVKGGHGAEVSVERVPEVANSVSEIPLSGQLDRRVERHGEDGHEEISHSQRDEEVVVDVTKLVTSHNADDNQKIAVDQDLKNFFPRDWLSA